MQRLLFIAALVAGVQSNSAAQTLKKCDDPRVPIGGLPSGDAVIWYRVGSDGKPDTSGMGVVEAHGMSAAGVRSVAVRLLSACRFDVGKGDPLSAGVLTSLRFDTAHIALGSTNRAGGPATLRNFETFNLPTDSIFPAGDRRIEEKPRGLKCPSPPRSPDFTGAGRGATQAEAQSAARLAIGPQIDNWNVMNSGQMVAEVIVNPNGRVDGNIRVVQASNPAATATLSEMVRGCTWVPGRALGVVVRTRARTVIVVAPLPRQ
jgi:hypothetical protein